MDVSTKQSLLVSCLKKSLFVPLLVGTLILTGCGEESSYSNSSNNANNSNNTVVDNPANTTDDPSLYLADTPKIETADNFRDIAGNSISTNYANVDGLKLRRGVIYRSNYLPLNETDLETFKTLDIKTVYDLRTNFEREKSPDFLSPDTNIMMVNIAGSKESDLPKGIATAEDMINFFNSSMANMAAHDKGTQLRFGVVINSLIYTDGVQLYHCTAGKDRTGWFYDVFFLFVLMLF